MNNLCKQYIKNVRALFPIIGKTEKQYLRKLELNLQEYCEETSASCIEELYRDLGSPSEVVNSYYSNVDMDYLLRQIKRTKIIKTTFVALILATLVSVSEYCILLYAEHKVFKAEQIFSEETFIE